MAIPVSGQPSAQANQVNTTKPAFNPSGRAKVLGSKFMARTCIFFSNTLSRKFFGDTPMKAARNYRNEDRFYNDVQALRNENILNIQNGERGALKGNVETHFKEQVPDVSPLWVKKHYRDCVVKEVLDFLIVEKVPDFKVSEPNTENRLTPFQVELKQAIYCAKKLGNVEKDTVKEVADNVYFKDAV